MQPDRTRVVQKRKECWVSTLHVIIEHVILNLKKKLTIVKKATQCLGFVEWVRIFLYVMFIPPTSLPYASGDFKPDLFPENEIPIPGYSPEFLSWKYIKHFSNIITEEKDNGN